MSLRHRRTAVGHAWLFGHEQLPALHACTCAGATHLPCMCQRSCHAYRVVNNRGSRTRVEHSAAVGPQVVIMGGCLGVGNTGAGARAWCVCVQPTCAACNALPAMLAACACIACGLNLSAPASISCPVMEFNIKVCSFSQARLLTATIACSQPHGDRVGSNNVLPASPAAWTSSVPVAARAWPSHHHRQH